MQQYKQHTLVLYAVLEKKIVKDRQGQNGKFHENFIFFQNGGKSIMAADFPYTLEL